MGAVWRSLVALGLGLVLALMLDQIVHRFVPPEAIVAERPRYLQTVQYHPILAWSGFPNFAETNDGIIDGLERGYFGPDLASDMQRLCKRAAKANLKWLKALDRPDPTT